MSDRIWFNGSWVDAATAHVHHDDHGLTVGDGVFETLLVRRGRAFALTRHLDRLARSAGRIGLTPPDLAELRSAIETVAADADGGFVRVTVTSGRGPLGSPRGDAPPTAIVARRPGRTREDPTAVTLAEGRRNEHSLIAGVKSTSYVENVVALAHAEAAGASEALFLDTTGRVCEGTGSNIFVVLEDRLITPSLASGCLAGITRALLLEAGVGVEQDLHVDDLARCTEAFLVSTGREVQPVTRVGEIRFPTAPGPHTVSARAVWLDRIEPLDDP